LLRSWRLIIETGDSKWEDRLLCTYVVLMAALVVAVVSFLQKPVLGTTDSEYRIVLVSLFLLEIPEESMKSDGRGIAATRTSPDTRMWSAVLMTGDGLYW